MSHLVAYRLNCDSQFEGQRKPVHTLGQSSVNCWPTASYYQLSHMRSGQDLNSDLRGVRRVCYHWLNSWKDHHTSEDKIQLHVCNPDLLQPKNFWSRPANIKRELCIFLWSSGTSVLLYSKISPTRFTVYKYEIVKWLITRLFFTLYDPLSLGWC